LLAAPRQHGSQNPGHTPPINGSIDLKLLGSWKRAIGDAGFGAMVLAVASLATSICLAIWISDKLAFEVESARVLAYAKDVLRRNEQTSEQVAAGLELLIRAADPNPCSDANLLLMQQIDFASSKMQAIGYMVDNRLICSSIGTHSDGLNVGPADFTTRLGFQIHQAVELPFAPGRKFAVVSRKDFAVILHKELPIDIAMDEPDGSVGIFTGDDRRFLMSRGPLQERWAKELRHGALENIFVRDEHLIVVLQSRHWSSGSIAALPVKYLQRRSHDFAIFLIPAGVVTGLALALLVLLHRRRQRGLASLLKRALHRGEFYLVYQPIVDLQSGHCTGAEVLLRWRHPAGELIPPDIFIQIAEDHGFIGQVTKHVLGLLSREAGGTFELRPDFHFAINIAAADLHSDRLHDQIQRLIADLRIEPSQLVLEATERGFIDVHMAQARVQQLRSLGVHVAIDDFGTGYSSLAYLETFNVDGLKIDKSFVDKIGTGSAASGVVGHIIEMAKELHLTMVAEGVETQTQADYLRARGVQLAQGSLFSKPLLLEDLLRYLQPDRRAVVLAV
jgi:sensor c-di-GMP phosphodiesterase-like protein